MRCFRFLFILALFGPSPGKAQDTLSLYFPTSIHELNPQQKSMLDSLLYLGWLVDGDSLVILGFADHQGDEAHNQQLSFRRAEAIRDHLFSRGWTSTRLRLEGKGALPATEPRSTGIPSHRRIDMRRWRPGAGEPMEEMESNPPRFSSTYHQWLERGKGETMALDQLLFYPGLRRVLPQSLPVLDTLFQFLKAHPTRRIRLEGHVCCVPRNADAIDEETMEQALSLNRARFIYQYLVDRGIDSNRLEYRGFGRRHPKVAIERTDEDRQANRRVEVRLLD